MVINMKKGIGVFVFMLLAVSLLAGTVSAASDFEGIMSDIGDGVDSFYDNLLEPVLGRIIGTTEGDGDTGSGELFLAKILFLLIIFSIIWTSLHNVPFFSSNDWVLWIVSISASILSIRWFGNADVIRSVILPYSVLGVAISAGLPFILSFLIIENNFKKTMRKFAWMFFAVVFVGLWITRVGSAKFALIYLITAIAAIIMMVMDGTIQKWKHKMAVEKGDITRKRKHYRFWLEELEKADKTREREPNEYKCVYANYHGKGSKAYDADVAYIQNEMAKYKV